MEKVKIFVVVVSVFFSWKQYTSNKLSSNHSSFQAHYYEDMSLPAEMNDVNSTEQGYRNSVDVNRAYGETAMVTNIEQQEKDIHVVTNMAYEQIGMITNIVYGEPDAIKNEAYGKMENINNENENQEHRFMTSVVCDNVLY